MVRRIGVAVEHGRHACALLQLLHKRQADGVDLPDGQAGEVLKVHSRAAVVLLFLDEPGEKGRLSPGLGLAPGGHVEVEAVPQAGLAGFFRVCGKIGVCVARALPGPDVDHLHTALPDLLEVNVPLVDAHINAPVGLLRVRPQGHGRG